MLSGVNADGIKQIVQRGIADIGLYCLSDRYKIIKACSAYQLKKPLVPVAFL